MLRQLPKLFDSSMGHIGVVMRYQTGKGGQRTQEGLRR